MQAFLQFLSDVLTAVVRVLLWLLTAVLALGLLSLALLLLLGGVLWALVRGRRSTPLVVVSRFQHYARQRVWPGRPAGPAAPTAPPEVVDVEAREVDTEPPPRRD